MNLIVVFFQTYTNNKVRQWNFTSKNDAASINISTLLPLVKTSIPVSLRSIPDK